MEQVVQIKHASLWSDLLGEVRLYFVQDFLRIDLWQILVIHGEHVHVLLHLGHAGATPITTVRAEPCGGVAAQWGTGKGGGAYSGCGQKDVAIIARTTGKIREGTYSGCGQPK